MMNTPNLGLSLDTLGYVRLRQAYVRNMRSIELATGLSLPTNVTGKVLFRNNVRDNLAKISAYLGLPAPAQFYNIDQLRRTLAAATVQFDTVIGGGTIPITLGTLSLSAVLASGITSAGSIIGATSGSTIFSTLPGLTVDSINRTFEFDGTGTVGASGVLLEILSGATNSPKSTPVAVEGVVVQFINAIFTAPEGNPGETKEFVATIVRNQTAGGLVVNTTYLPGTADANDFVNGIPGNQSFVFTDGSPTASRIILVKGDADEELNDTFGFSIDDDPSYTVGANRTFSGLIVNDDTGSVGGPQPITAASLTDNGNGTYTVTPAVWASNVVVSNQTKRRDSQPIAGLSGNLITAVAGDNGTFVDYAETGTLDGVSTTISTVGYVIPVALSKVIDVASVDTNDVPILTSFPVLQAHSVGSSSDLGKVVTGSGGGLIAKGRDSEVKLLVPTESDTFNIVWQDNFKFANALWDYDADNGNYVTISWSGSYIFVQTFENGSLSTKYFRDVGSATPSDGGVSKNTVSVTVDTVSVTLLIAGQYQSYVFPRPLLSKQTQLAGISISNQYTALGAFSVESSKAPFSIAAIDRIVDGKFTVAGKYQGAVPTGAMEYRAFDPYGVEVFTWRAMDTVSIANNNMSFQSKLQDGRLSSLLNKRNRFQFRFANKPNDVFGFHYSVAGYVEPSPVSIGTNCAGTQSAYRGSRVYTDMFRQAVIITPDGGYGTRIGNSTRIDNLGNPIGEGVGYQLPMPDKDGPTTLEVIIEEGKLPDNLSWVASQSSPFSNFRRVSDQKYLVDLNVNRQTDNTFVLRYEGLDIASPPKKMFLRELTDDKTQTYTKAFIDFQNTFDGPIRHMDNLQTNYGTLYDDYAPDFTKRPKREEIGGSWLGVPLEDIVELSNLTDRPIHMTMHVGWMTSPTHREFGRKTLDLLFNGVGANYGVGGMTTTKRHTVEFGNELWNFNLGGNGSQCRFLGKLAKANGRASFATDGSNDAGWHNAAYDEAPLQFYNSMLLLEEVVPDFATRCLRTFGVQMGVGSIGRYTGLAIWPQARAHMDAIAIAPYIGGDTNAGTSATVPASYDPVGFRDFYRERLPATLDKINGMIAIHQSLSLQTVYYEWNLSLPAIAGRNAEQERAFKLSQECYDFMLNEVCPAVIPIGGASCVYSDVGVPSNQESWYVYEGPNAYQGNQPYNAIIDYGKAAGYLEAA